MKNQQIQNKNKKNKNEEKRNELSDFLDDTPAMNITINKQFAQRYEGKKLKEELSKVKREEIEEEESSSSEEEDEDGVLLTPSFEKSFLAVLPLIKNRDAKIYDQNSKFFPEFEVIAKEAAILNADDDDDAPSNDNDEKKNTKMSDSTDHSSSSSSKKKKRPVYLKDAIRNDILEKINKVGDDEIPSYQSDDDEEEDKVEVKVDANELLSHEDELKNLKSKILAKFNDSSNQLHSTNDDDDDEDDFLVVRKKSDYDLQADESLQSQWESQQRAKAATKLVDGKGKKVDIQTFWTEDTADPNERFLRDFVLNEKWLEKEQRIPSYEELVGKNKDIDEEDMEAIEKQEQFEHSYNFRFEEPESNVVVTHPREIDESVRRKSDKRKKKREARKEKKLLEKVRKEEELKRMKNLKKMEIKNKLEEIQKVTGTLKNISSLSHLDFDKPFDPDEYDQHMQQLFNDDYYNDDDCADDQYPFHDDDDAAHPYFEDDDHYYNDDDDGHGGDDNDDHLADAAENSKLFSKKRTELLSKFNHRDDDDDDDYYDEQIDDGNKEAIDPQLVEKKKKDIDRFIEEYYHLDYEDIIGDTAFRFPYQKVSKNSFGVDVNDILEMEDKELNRFVPLKKLAPYHDREFEPKLPWKKLKSKLKWEKQQQLKNTSALSDNASNQPKNRKKKKDNASASHKTDDVNNDATKSSSESKSKRKRNRKKKNSKPTNQSDAPSSDKKRKREDNNGGDDKTSNSPVNKKQKKK